MQLDIIAFLEDRGIIFTPAGGKNCMQEHIVIECTHCPTPDPSRHLNIKVDGSHAYCLRCNYRTTNIITILRDCLFETNINLNELAEQFPYTGEVISEKVDNPPDKVIKFNKLWNSFYRLNPKKSYQKFYVQYLEKRNIDLDWAEEFDIRVGNGDWNYYVIAPLRDMLGNVASFLSRKINNVGQKHNACPESKSIISASSLISGLYESSKLGGKYLIICEGGMFDVFNLLQYKVKVVGLMKKKITDAQLELLVNHIPYDTKILLTLDMDTIVKERRDLLLKLSSQFPDICSLSFDKRNDFGAMKEKDVKQLKKILKQKYYKRNYL